MTYTFSKKNDTQLTARGFALGTLCTLRYNKGGIDESEDGRRSSAWSEKGTFTYEGAKTKTTAVVRVGKNVHTFNVWDPSLDLGVTDFEAAMAEIELLDSAETAAAAAWFTALFQNWSGRIRLSDTVEISAPELTEAGIGVSRDASAILSMHVDVYNDANIRFGEIVPTKTLALDVYRMFNGVVDPAQVNETTRSEYATKKAAEQAEREAQVAWKEDVKMAAAKVVTMFNEMAAAADGQLEVTFWDSELSMTTTRCYRWLEVKSNDHPFNSDLTVTVTDDWRRELTVDEVNAIVAKYYEVEVTAPVSTPTANSHFIGSGWDLTDKHQIRNDEFGAAAKSVGYGDTFDWSKPARLRQTRKGDDFLVNDDNGAYFRFLCFGSATDANVDGKIVWQYENSYGDVYMIIATTPSPDPDENFDNTPSDNTDDSVTPEVSSNDGEVFSSVNVMKGDDDMFEFNMDSTVFTIGNVDDNLALETPIVFVNTGASNAEEESVVGQDNLSNVTCNTVEEQPGAFSDSGVSSSQFNVVTATVPFDLQLFGNKKGENNMKKTKTNKIKAQGGRKILSPFAVYAKQIVAAEEKARDDAKGFNVKDGLTALATDIDSAVATYTASLSKDEAKECVIERYVFVLATEIMRKYRDSLSIPCTLTDTQVINSVDQIVEMAHLIAEREGSQMNIWQLSFGNVNEGGIVRAQYAAQIAHISYNRVVKAADLGIGGVTLGTKAIKVGDLTNVVDRFCPDLVELNFLGNLDEVVKLSKGLYQAKTERSADILVAFRHGLPSLFVEDLETGEYDAYIHPGLYTADVKTAKFLRAFTAKRDKVVATIEKLPEYEEAEIKKAGADLKAIKQKYVAQKANYESQLARYNDQIDHLTDQVRASQQVPTTFNGILEWADEVRRVEKDYWLSSAGMLKKNVYLVPTRRIDIPEERNFGAFYDYACTGTYRHICRMTEGKKLSPKQFSQYANRFSNTMAPGRLFDEAVPQVIAITPHKLGVTTDGQFLLNGEYVQNAFNTISGYYFTLAAVCTLAIQCRPGMVSIKGVGDTVYPDVMHTRIAAEIETLNALPHHPDQKPDKAGNYVVRIVAGELTEQEEKDFFEFRENQKNARWQNCLVLRYTNREAMERDLEDGNVPTASVFVDFNSFKCTAEAKPVLDKEGRLHTCDTGLHVLSIAHKSTVSNMSSQLLTGWLAASPKETMAKVHGAVNPVIERQWVQQRDLVPGFVSATEMRPRTVFTAEGESETMIPDYNRLSGVAAPIFGRIYAPDGQAEISKAVRSMSRRFGEFKIPMRISSYLVACDPALLFGGDPVLRAQEGCCEVLTAEKNSGTGRLHRYPKTRVDDALRVRNIGIGAYLRRLFRSGNSTEVKLMTALFVMNLCHGVCCLPDVPDLFTTIGGADTDGDHCSIVWEDPENEPKLTSGIEHGLCVEKPKNSDADPFDAAFDSYEKAYRETDANNSERVKAVVENGKRARSAWDKVKDDKSALETCKKAAKLVRQARTAFETVKAQGFDEKTYLNPDPDNVHTQAYDTALAKFKAAVAEYEQLPYVKAKHDLVTTMEDWYKTVHDVKHESAIAAYLAALTE